MRIKAQELNRLIFSGFIKILLSLIFFKISWSSWQSENVVNIRDICLIFPTSSNTRWSSFSNL